MATLVLWGPPKKFTATPNYDIVLETYYRYKEAATCLNLYII